MYPPLPDDEALAAARRMRLRDPERVIHSPVVRRVVEAAYWAIQRLHDRRLHAMSASRQVKRMAAGDRDD